MLVLRFIINWSRIFWMPLKLAWKWRLGISDWISDNTGSIVYYDSFAVLLPSALMGAMYTTVLAKSAVELLVRKCLVTREQNSSMTLLRPYFQIIKILFVLFVWFCVSMYPLSIAIAFFPYAPTGTCPSVWWSGISRPATAFSIRYGKQTEKNPTQNWRQKRIR